MQVQSHWSHVVWKHDDERRLHLTLGFSVLLHALLLLAWKLPPQVWKAADHAVLTVVLRGAAPLAQSSPAAGQKREVAVLLQKDPAPAGFSVPPRPAAQGAAAAPAANPQPPAPAASRARLAPQPTPGRVSNSTPAAVGVTVMLVIDADGRVGQIFWDKLPALTDEQLRHVETVMRQKTYASGRILNELVDVLGILKLPPERPQESLAPQVSPAGE